MADIPMSSGQKIFRTIFGLMLVAVAIVMLAAEIFAFIALDSKWFYFIAFVFPILLGAYGIAVMRSKPKSRVIQPEIEADTIQAKTIDGTWRPWKQ